MDKSDVATLICLEAFRTHREGMVAENQIRISRGEALAYGEDAFTSLEIEIRGLLSRDKGPEMACPFCGSEEKEIGKGPELTYETDAEGTVVRCKNCGSYGPWADTRKGALEQWEKRRNQPKP